MSAATILALVRSEFSGLVADRGALGLVAVVGLVLGIAAVLGGATGFANFFFIAFVLLPLFSTAVGAIQVSGERASGYSAVLHTAPLTPRSYYAAKVAVSFAWALLAIGMGWAYALFFAALAGWGVVAMALAWLPVALLLSAYSACLGMLLSVLVGKRGLLPSAFAGIGLALALALVPLFLQFLPEAMRESARGLARLSPLLNLLGSGTSPADLATAAGQQGFAAVAYFAAVFAGVGALAYVRYQNPEGWDASPRRALPLLALGALLVVAPAAVLGEPPQEQGRALPVGLSASVAGLSAEEPVVLDVGRPRTFTLVLAVGEVRGEERPFIAQQAGGPSQAEPPTLTHVRVRFPARPPLRAEPHEAALPDWGPAPCPAPAPSECVQYEERRVEVTLTLDALPALLGRAREGFFVALDSDQGTAMAFPGAQFEARPPPYGWWWPLLVWVGLVGAFAAPQALRARRLGRRVQLQVVRRPAK